MSSDKLFFACNTSVLRAEMSSSQRSVMRAQLINIELGFQLSCLSSHPHANSTTHSGLYPTDDRIFNHSSCITKLKIMVQLLQNDILKASMWTICQIRKFLLLTAVPRMSPLMSAYLVYEFHPCRGTWKTYKILLNYKLAQIPHILDQDFLNCSMDPRSFGVLIHSLKI